MPYAPQQKWVFIVCYAMVRQPITTRGQAQRQVQDLEQISSVAG